MRNNFINFEFFLFRRKQMSVMKWLMMKKLTFVFKTAFQHECLSGLHASKLQVGYNQGNVLVLSLFCCCVKEQSWTFKLNWKLLQVNLLASSHNADGYAYGRFSHSSYTLGGWCNNCNILCTYVQGNLGLIIVHINVRIYQVFLWDSDACACSCELPIIQLNSEA